MADEKKTILLNGGREVSVTLVTKAHDFLTQVLGGASAKSGIATLQVVKNTAGKPFVAVLIGGKHVGFLSDSDAQELFAILGDCERDGLVAQAKGTVTASPDGTAKPTFRLSLAEPGQLLEKPQVHLTAPPAEAPKVEPMPDQYCCTCGKGLPAGAKFCLECGTPVVVAPAPTEGTAEPTTPVLPVAPRVAPLQGQVVPRAQFSGAPSKGRGWWGRRSGLQKAGVIVGTVAVLAIAGTVAGTAGDKGKEVVVSSTTTVVTAKTAASAEATTATTAAPTTADDAQASYQQDVKDWWDEWQPKIGEHIGALDNLDPLTVSDEQIGAVDKFAEVMSDAAKKFSDIEPPASAAPAHADYASVLQGMANGLERLQKALDAGDLSSIMEAYAALEVEDADATKAALEQAAGVKLGSAATNVQTPATTSTAARGSDVGSKDNPVPLGTAQQVGDWAVTVVKYTPDATAAVLKANQFNDEPEAGHVYVLVEMSAKYTGEESGTFWVDMSYKFLGKAGNTFDTPMMVVAPKPISDAGETFPGASVSGNLVFEVATDQAAEGLLIMEESFSFDETRVFFALP